MIVLIEKLECSCRNSRDKRYFCRCLFHNTVAVVDIKELVTGKDCPHVKDKKNKVINVWHVDAFSVWFSACLIRVSINFF